MVDPERVARALHRLAEQRVSEAMEAGAFDNLPGVGKPLADLNEPYDELWWVKKWLARERSGDLQQQPGDKRFGQVAAVETLRISKTP